MADQRLKTHNTCQKCGVSFRPFRNSRGLYCSNQCKFEASKSPITLTCVGCGKTFQKSTHKDGKFCTNECYQTAKKSRSALERLMPFVEKTNYCWLWTGSVNAMGYGRLYFQGKFWLAHRLMYQTIVGDIPNGQLVRHYVCDNPPCVNPDHLKVGTHPDNAQDMVNHNRHAHGETSYAKLTEIQVLTILKDTRTHQAIANDYNVARRTIGHIKKGSTWKHLPR